MGDVIQINPEANISFNRAELAAYLETVREHVRCTPDDSHHKAMAINQLTDLIDRIRSAGLTVKGE
ncbi:hypothetical protein [Yersinia rohdei]|uniref:hypothetical protein n=1 Tax=Yersinia rohdei TaxID=29485 RepID=UPI00066FFEF9|nr:hypothetical protein [Yersinia rohdei]